MARTTDFVDVPGGTFLMGADDRYPEEAPAHPVHVAAVRMMATTVTNDDFAEFVRCTGHVTAAERPLDPDTLPGATAASLTPGSSVFTMPAGPVPLSDVRRWWRWVPGANWRHPEGPGSDIRDRGDHPVVHVAHEDARAYASWAGLRLPTEAEWERAARGGLDGAEYAWGEEFTPDGRVMANTWFGEFPWQRRSAHERTCPVRSFPPNGYGLFEMIGNVWEWTDDPWTDDHAGRTPSSSCCSPTLSPGAGGTGDTRVIKGGSFLCAPSYCRRYRPAARQPQAVDTGTSHLGFRCVGA